MQMVLIIFGVFLLLLFKSTNTILSKHYYKGETNNQSLMLNFMRNKENIYFDAGKVVTNDFPRF